MARNHNRSAVIVTVAALAAVGTFIVWRVAFPPDVPQFAVVVDRSGSPTFPVCLAVSGIVRQALVAPGAVKESQLALIATGDASNNFQGKLLKRSFLAKRRQATRNPRKQTQAEDEYVEQQVASCRSGGTAPRSPILNAVTAAVADLRGLGCRGQAPCRVDVVSDGSENVDPTLAAALKGDVRAERRLSPVVDNRGIAIAFCGAAQSASQPAAGNGRGSADRLGHLQRVWSAVFSEPALVTVQPFCGDGATQSTALR